VKDKPGVCHWGRFAHYLSASGMIVIAYAAGLCTVPGSGFNQREVRVTVSL